MGYNYSSTAGLMHISGAIGSGAGSFTVDSVAGLPSPDFKLVIDPGQASEEIVKVTGVAGTTLTVTRGWDSTLAVSHANGAEVRHVFHAEDARLASQHIDATAGVHGVTGPLAGTTDTQTITNKTFQAATTETPIKVRQSGGSTSDLLQVLTSGGSIRAKVNTLGLYLRSAAADVIEFINGDGEAGQGFLARFTPALTGTDGVRFEMPNGSTGKAIKVNLNGVEKAYIEADGDAKVDDLLTATITASGALTAPSAAIAGATSVGSLTSSGVVSGTNLTGSGTVSGATVTSSGAVSGTTGTFNSGVTSPQTTFIGNEGAMVGSGPSAGTRKLSYDRSLVVTTDANGVVNLAYSAAYANGLVSVNVTPGDSTGTLVACKVILGNTTLSTVHVQAYGVPFGGGSLTLLTNTTLRFCVSSAGW